jgi:hypothetical protein
MGSLFFQRARLESTPTAVVACEKSTRRRPQPTLPRLGPRILLHPVVDEHGTKRVAIPEFVCRRFDTSALGVAFVQAKCGPAESLCSERTF